MRLIKPRYQEMADESLMVSISKGDKRAFDEIYNRYSGPLLGYFMRMLWRDREKAEDFVHDIFAKIIRKPASKQKDVTKKLKYTIWTSCGYEYDGFHSYEGEPDKEFNSSYSTLKEANERVEYVFYFDNPWGLEREEMFADSNFIDKKGTRFMSCSPDDSETWTVAVVPSIAFDYLND